MTFVAHGHAGQTTVPASAALPSQDTSLTHIVADLGQQANEQMHQLEATTTALRLLAEQIAQHQQSLLTKMTSSARR